MEMIIPDWNAPASIKAFTTTQHLGNLAKNVGEPNETLAHRQSLVEQLQLPTQPHWLNQVHGTTALILPSNETTADAAITHTPNIVCAVFTADCLPILLCNRQASEVAAIHAGWRGLAAGIIPKTIAKMQSRPSDLVAWLGPAISQAAFEVGPEVRETFIETDPLLAQHFIASQRSHHFMADLYGIARSQLQQLGVSDINGGNFCTYHDPRFYSYRREKATGRMASLIWIASNC
jgi:YfiH family protein